MLAFSIPPLALITTLAFLHGSYANWAAPAFISAAILVSAVLVREQNRDLAQNSYRLRGICSGRAVIRRRLGRQGNGLRFWPAYRSISAYYGLAAICERNGAHRAQGKCAGNHRQHPFRCRIPCLLSSGYKASCVHVASRVRHRQLFRADRSADGASGRAVVAGYRLPPRDPS